MESIIYRVALSQAKYLGIATLRYLLDQVESLEEIFQSREYLHRIAPKLSKRVLDELFRPNLLDEAKGIVDWAMTNTVRLVFYTDHDYPRRLYQIPDAPKLLYIKGNYSDWETELMLSVVGTRNMTSYGSQSAERILGELHDLGSRIPIVSGLAYGVDILAHRKALSLGLPTIAVFAHGFDRIYPYAHRGVAEEMLSSGAWVSEYPPYTNPDRYNFVGRNRIIAGLSDATFVVEAGLKSGSLITADLAAGYDREVLALPGRVSDKYSQGCNLMIRQQKAVLVTSGEDILNALGWQRIGEVLCQDLQFEEVYQEDTPLLALIRKGQPIHQNELMRQSGLTSVELNAQLVDLELEDRIVALPGGLYAVR